MVKILIMENTSKIELQFIEKQKELFSQIDLNNYVDINKIKTVAGVDLAYWKENEEEYACACIVVLDYNSLEIIEEKYTVGTIEVPYIPGCLAFREFELVQKTVDLLEHEIDLYFFDGNGYLHPRHMGLATYAGIVLNKPSIGVAKTYFKVENVEYTEPENEKFSQTNIIINNEIYGRVLITQKDVKPIFLSIGNKINIETATEVVKHFVDKKSHIPLPTRYADIMTHEVRKNFLQKDLKNLSSKVL